MPSTLVERRKPGSGGPCRLRSIARWQFPTAENYAFLGQFVEIPDGVVFTVEYSVRSAMMAVYHHFGVKREIPPIYHGLSDPKVAWSALKTAFA